MIYTPDLLRVAYAVALAKSAIRACYDPHHARGHLEDATDAARGLRPVAGEDSAAEDLMADYDRLCAEYLPAPTPGGGA